MTERTLGELKANGVLFRVFQGADCEYRYIAGKPEPTDHIVWGEHLYNLRIRYRPMTLLYTLHQIMARNGGSTGGAA